MKKNTLLLSLLLLLSSASAYSKVLIWDIGDVLYKTSEYGVARSIGLSHFIGYALFSWQNPKNIKPVLFDVLNQIPCSPIPEGIQACTSKGTALPPIMCHWQAGTLSGDEIIRRAERHIETLSQEGYFMSRRERQLILKTIYAMFDPYTLAENMYPIRSGLRLFHRCAHETNNDGTPRNYMIGLSNWDPTSFDIFYDLNESALSHFDKLFVSGKTGLIKPRKAAYEDLIKRLKLNPKDCLVIDDQEVNLKAAQELGFETFHVRRRNYRDLQHVLINCGALS